MRVAEAGRLGAVVRVEAAARVAERTQDGDRVDDAELRVRACAGLGALVRRDHARKKGGLVANVGREARLAREALEGLLRAPVRRARRQRRDHGEGSKGADRAERSARARTGWTWPEA